ncbi:MAG: tRNA guanosine(34) transglycosylase Tgt, partial [Bacteroidales bacterium]|nr:tRNA guanosine(34) transglycosylase Tgt [Bacteroidales bacterium]
FSLHGRRKITEEGVKFLSDIDGSKHLFTPENVIDIQRTIGSDIIMAFDECTPYPTTEQYAEQSMQRTHRWLVRCYQQWKNTECPYGRYQSLFPIVQGSVFRHLREQSAEFVANMDCDGNAIGGVSVGEPTELMYEMTAVCCDILPKDKPRYLMGVGTPANILECIALGVDMFDCVMPTRNGRHGILFTKNGVINIKNAKWKYDFSPIEEDSDLFEDKNYSKAYLRHLLINQEMLSGMICSLHNLHFYLWLVKESRKHILEGDFSRWKTEMVQKVSTRL